MQLKESGETDQVINKPDNADGVMVRASSIGKPIVALGAKVKKWWNAKGKKRNANKVLMFFGTKCENRFAREYFGKKYRTCPIPKAERIVRERPWYCYYCELKDTQDPNA